MAFFKQKLKKRKGLISVNSNISSNKITSYITVSNNLKEYFNNYNFYISYDETITANKSILDIPVLSRILPLAWITGADVYVDELDETYAKSLCLLQQEYKKMYPKAPFQTKIITEKQTKNNPNPKGAALLFSGGIDSTYSLFKNIHLNPRLIRIFGIAGTPISNVAFQNLIKKKFSNFAEQNKLKINFVSTNAMTIFNRKKVNHLWNKYKETHQRDFWDGIGFSLGQISFLAPLSIGRFNSIIISAGSQPDISPTQYPYASFPTTDEKISWLNLKVKHYGCIYRYKKILEMKNFMHKHNVKIRVCFSSSKNLIKNKILNCSKCLKCLHTQVNILLAGLNPNDHGFHFDKSTFRSIKFLLEARVLNKTVLLINWKNVQNAISEDTEIDLYGSKQFFKWFKSIDFNLIAKKQNRLTQFYNRFPYSLRYWLEISKIVNIFGYILGFNRKKDINIWKPIEPSLNKQ